MKRDDWLKDSDPERPDWSSLIPRYISSFSYRELPHFFTDVLIIGGGLAGLRAAHEIPSDLTALVITKDALRESNSAYAQGGIASVWDEEDRFDNHVQDTLTAGGPLCDPQVVELVVKEAPQRVEELMSWGTQFDQRDGRLVLGREGGHSHQRIIHALGDATGKEIMRAMMAHSRLLPHVRIWEQTFTIDLLTHDGHCKGALVWREGMGAMMVWAKQTILCTGGCGQVFRESTNPRVATGDGHAVAFRAGARLRDMEFMQFHPTVLYIAGSSRTLITEAIRGEGAHLIDSHGVRFMSDYDARLELAPRDIVSQSIVRQMEKTRHPCVYLSLRHLDPEFVHRRFPGIAEVCRSFGLDIARDNIPVRPGAHYMVGGLNVDIEGRTTLPGLWAAGEVTSSGLHGANRLASNSLLEGLVYGARAGRAACLAARSDASELRPLPLSNTIQSPPADHFDISDVRNSIQSMMWRFVGVERTAKQLEEAWHSNTSFCRYVLRYPFQEKAGWELQNILTVATLMSYAALYRTESRGVHLRTDFPKSDDAKWLHHIDVQRMLHT